MFTHEEYVKAWLFYLFGATLFMVGWWFITAHIKWREPKLVLRVMAAVFFLLPWKTGQTLEEGAEYLSPAWIVAIFEALLEGPEAFWRAGTPLLLSLMSAVIISSLIYVGFWFLARRSASS